jgi:hypothetical protein
MQPSEFSSWVERVLEEDVPPSVVAYSFNLSEPWQVELIGSDRFDPTDPEWACPPEAFRSSRGALKLEEAPNQNWEAVLTSAMQALSEYLKLDSPGAGKLKSSQAVCVGFVDGDLHRVWP